MAATLRLSYDQEGDILHITTTPVQSAADFEFIGEDLVARYDPASRAVDHLDILGFSKRLGSLGATIEIPVDVKMTLHADTAPCD